MVLRLLVSLLYLFFWICWFLFGLNFWWVAGADRGWLEVNDRERRPKRGVALVCDECPGMEARVL